MNMIIDGLPQSVTIAGEDVEIETGHRTGMIFEQVIHDKKITSEEKLETVLALYFGKRRIPDHLKSEAVEKIIDFYRCGRQPKEEEPEPGEDAETVQLSYEHDAPYIFASFMHAYNIDLTQNEIHWWQFRALLEALPEDTIMMKIIGYRTAKVPEKASSETRQRIEKMRKIYALPIDTDQDQLTTDLDAILMAGGNPFAIFEKEGAKRSWHLMEH